MPESVTIAPTVPLHRADQVSTEDRERQDEGEREGTEVGDELHAAIVPAIASESKFPAQASKDGGVKHPRSNRMDALLDMREPPADVVAEWDARIRRTCAEIQADWSDVQREHRRYGIERPEPVSIPMNVPVVPEWQTHQSE